MEWQVLWTEEAGRALLDVLRSSRFANLIESDVRRYNEQIGKAPLSLGESREANRRVFVALPYVFSFIIHPAERRVVVVEFRYVVRT